MTNSNSRGNISTQTTFAIYDVLSSIPDDKKSILKNDSLLISENYFKTLEEALIPGMSFRYVFFLKNNIPKGFYYFQLINLSSKELGKIVHLDPYSKTLNHFSGVINAILFGAKKDKPHYLLIGGNMIISGEFGIINNEKNGDVYQNLNGAIKEVTIGLEKEGKVVATIIKDFPTENDKVKETLLAKSFSLMVMDPIMKMGINSEWNRFLDYLDSLSSKYRLRYVNARKKIENITIRNLDIQEIISNKDAINLLYKSVQNKSPIQLLKCDFNYLLSIANNFNDKFVFRAFFEKDKMIAFLCGINCGDHYEAHHIGIDYNYNRSHALYLNILYEFIGLAIEAKSLSLYFGRTAMEMKTTVGAIPIQHNAYLKLNNYMLNCLVKSFLPTEMDQNWIQRNPFKESA